MDQDREEDSGLHDIRNLAQSTKQRLSSRRITSQPVSDDVLASSSGAFKNIALPQPAAMVSLPAVDDLPSKAEIAAAEKAAKEAAKKAAKEAKESSRSSKPALAAVAPAAPVETPVAAAVPARQAFSLPSQQRKASKGPLLAILGLGVAAAAGGVIYMQVQKNQDSAPEASAVAKQEPAAVVAAPAAGSAAEAAPAAAPAITAEPIAPPPAEAAKEEAAAGAAQLATDNVKDAEEKADTKTQKKAPSKKGAKSKVEKDDAPKAEEVKPVEKPDPKKPVATKSDGGEAEPSFDALLKEAGVDSQKKEAKPKLDKKSLSSDDFKKGMSAPAGKAKGCYKGTQGTAMVKLTVAPSGAISKLAVTGEFAGKPEASCIESALKAASFPPWDGGPQSFTYSVLLSD